MNQSAKLYQRNLIKEKIQDKILNFVYNHPAYKKLIFTGGSCLRKIYGLPRLSEDLDFDYYNFPFEIKLFAQKVKKYFQSQEKIALLEVKISRNQRTVFLKFPLASFSKINIPFNPEEKIFVRCDFSQVGLKYTQTEINPYNSEDLSFFVLSYDLPTLFTNKILAFLERKFFKGKEQKIPFKGRDLFDIIWLLQLSAKSSFQLKPNWTRLEYLLKETNRKKVIKAIIDKANTINPQNVFNDLVPFIESEEYLANFLSNYQSILKNKLKFII